MLAALTKDWGGEKMIHAQLVLLFPQWQGSGSNKNLYHGVKLIRDRLLKGIEFAEIGVSLEEELVKEKEIIGYRYIYDQLKEAAAMLEQKRPQRVFLIGGDCGTELAPVSYLNRRLKGDLFVLWFDAHGDLNTPESSPSKAFHGMPLRFLLGEGEKSILDLCFSTLLPVQLALVGGRDLDRAEVDYLEEKNITTLTVEQIRWGKRDFSFIRERGFSNIYIHLDLDVLDPEMFPHVMLPSPGGFDLKLLLRTFEMLRRNYHVAGYSIQEYSPREEGGLEQLRELVDFGLKLPAFS